MDAQQSRDQEIERLSAQVARLQAQLRTRPAPVGPPAATRLPGRGRRLLAVLLITLGVLLAPISVVAAWTKTELTDTDQFVATAAPLLDDPAFQTFLVDEVTAAINEEIDLEAITSDLFDGIAGLDLSPRAAEALQLLEQPAV